MRRKIIAGNWKMNAVKSEAVALINGLLDNYDSYSLTPEKEVVIAAPFPYIHYCSSMFAPYPHLYAAAQNCSEYAQGAYTGEVSARIIASLDVKYVIVGHSERRQYFQETDEMLLLKIQQAHNEKLLTVFCCGEPLEVRERHDYFAFIKTQLDNCIFQLSENEISQMVIAYEPIWAIGTGKTATPEQAQEVHAFIRKEIAKKYNKEVAEQLTILYCGSVNAKNAEELFACADIDGGLVGGASLKVQEFSDIIKAMH